MSISIEKKWMKKESIKENAEAKNQFEKWTDGGGGSEYPSKMKMSVGGGGDAEYPSKKKMSEVPPKRRQEEIAANWGPTVYAS